MNKLISSKMYQTGSEFNPHKDKLTSHIAVTKTDSNRKILNSDVEIPVPPRIEERIIGKDDDPFAIVLGETDLESKKTNILATLVKFCLVLLLLYVFICSLDFMASGFRLLSGKTTGAVFQNEYISNPIVGLMMGVLVTVLVQSSSTSTSIVVSMVNARILNVRDAIPIVMGANIGTSVTNTIVSLTQIGDKDKFRRAFAGATVHDIFNWLNVILLTSIEIPFHLLEKLSAAIVNSAFDYEEKQKATKIKILKVITEPFTKMIIRIDKKTLTGWSHDDPKFENHTLNLCYNTKLNFPNDTKLIAKKCNYLFAELTFNDTTDGIILVTVALVLLCVSLLFVVKILNSVLKGTLARMLKKVINSDIAYVPWLTGYLAIAIGAVMTFIVQSSSIFTSTLTPLIGLGLISVDRSYPLTLGSNVGTTTTAMLASIVGEGDGLRFSVQIAIVHLLFNLIGILVFYPIPFMRFPIPVAKMLGNITAKYRWFAGLYLIVMFFLLPAFVFGLSLEGPLVLACVGGPILALLILVIFLNIVQNKFPRILPPFLRNWNFLPLPFRSLEPYDRIIRSIQCCTKCNFATKETRTQNGIIASPNKSQHLDFNNSAFIETESSFSTKL